MSFTSYDMYLTAIQHREELAKHAAQFRLVRLGRQPFPSAPRRTVRQRGHPDAA